MSDDIKKIMDDVNAIREKADKVGTDSAEFKEFQAKAEASLEASEKKNAEIVANEVKTREKLENLEGQYKDLEVEMARKSEQSGVDYKELPEYKALNILAKGGMDALESEQKALLRTDNDVQGGYLTTSEMDNAIIRAITEISPVRQVSRVRSVGKKTLEMPVRKSIPTATYEGEAEAASESNSTYGNETLTCFRLTTKVRFTMDMLLDSAFDIENEVLQDVAEAFGFTEGKNFVLGDGAKKPEGFLVDPTIVADARTTESSTTVTGDDLLLMTGDLKVGYNPLFGFNRQTLAHLRTLKGSDGQYLWQAGLAPNQPNTIGGEGYVVMQDMPAFNVAGNLGVIYGDFARGYTIIDRTGTTMIRDDYTRKRENIVEITFHKYNTGQVTLPEAFKALKIKA